MGFGFLRAGGAFTFFTLAALAAPGCGTNTALPYGPPKIPDAGLDAGDPGPDAGPDAMIPCIDVPIDGGPVNASLAIQAQVGRADVALLIDVTSSMLDEIDRIREKLRDVIAPAIREAIPDSEIGVASFADFPAGSYGVPPDDYVFRLGLPVTSDLTAIQAALDALTIRNGSDSPEAQVEAMYQLATGEGLLPYVPPSAGCPSGGVGYPCFRRDALPVVLIFTDAQMHNGPTGMHPYDPFVLGVTPHTAAQSEAALVKIGARVIGFDSGAGEARPDLSAFALATGAVDSSGSPLVYEIGTSGEHLDEQVVNAIRTFATTVVQDVDAVARDGNPTDGVDATTLVEAITPLSAKPMSGVSGITATSFQNVAAGTELTFQITIRAGALVPGPTAKLVALEVVFRGNGRTRLGSDLVYLLIPGADGKTCADLGGTGP